MDWVKEYRSLFPAVNRCVYMDTAYDCGGSEIGKKAAMRYFDDWANAAVENQRGGPGRKVFFDTLDETRQMIGTLLGGVEPCQIAFTRNTNEGINAILQGFDFSPADNIVTDAIEHVSVLMPCLNAKKLKGVEVRIAGDSDTVDVSPAMLMEQCDQNTRMILVSHVQSATGSLIDLETLGEFCKKKGIYLIVDAIQSLGQIPFDAVRWNVSAVSAAGYKGLGAVESTGFVYVAPELMRRIWPVYTAANFFISVVRDEGAPYLRCSDDTKARKLENSSPDNLGVYILHDALEKLLQIGIDLIWAHIDPLYQKLHQGLCELGYRVLTSAEKGAHGASMAIEVSDPQELFAFFRERNIALSAGRYIRLSLGAYSTEEDVDAVLSAAKDCPIR